MKKYPEVEARINKYVSLVATETLMLPAELAEDFIARTTRRHYKLVCKRLNKGLATVDEVMSEYPLD